MEQLTYDPILDEREISRVRVFKPLRAPRPQEAMVLEPGTGALRAFRHGEPIPGARLTDYRRMYLVDIAEHRLTLDFTLLSRDHTIAFNARADLLCQIADPAKVVERGIRDVSGALYGPLKRMLQDVSRHYDALAFHEAQQALNQEMRYFSGDSAIRLREIVIELLIDADEAAASGREFRDRAREQRLDDMRSDHRLERLRRDGVEGLIADIAETEGASAALDRIQAIEQNERNELVTAWDSLLRNSAEPLEPHQIAEAQQRLLDRYTEGSSAPFGGTRPRLRGSLAPEIGPAAAPPPLPPPVRATPVEARADTPSEETAASHGAAATPLEPPEDEPPGGAPYAAAPPPDTDGGNGADRPRTSRVRGFRTGDPER
ncbi:hypothetical protein [Actinomadura macrotermitis]|uniref:SPFH domain / Band 7 family protein n=1 Tax=Actinomadura macrotermitis TaxID=2585200 RepID=A0A7K0BXE7_9ACTN|nr:hypothetical protein [Actinomadura macrotermitis]MQY05860.1 hypothetical protein [Actinomadura macrotermitis]